MWGEIIKNNIKMKKSDRVMIITDYNKLDIAHKLFKNVLDLSNKAMMIVIKPPELDGEEPPKDIQKMIDSVDVLFELTTFSITHTDLTKKALKKNCKVISMPAVSEETLKAIPVDSNKIIKLTEKIAGLLSSGSEIKIITKKGTNLSLNIKNKNGFVFDGISENGKVINLPDGEACISPNTADGTLIVDGSMPPDSENEWGVIGKIENQIKIEIKNGKISGISGSKESKILKKIFSHLDKKAKQVAEFGIGTNSEAKIIGNVTVDEKALGTIHIAFGNNSIFGGRNKTPVHLDAVIKKPTVYIDGKFVMKEGKLKI